MGNMQSMQTNGNINYLISTLAYFALILCYMENILTKVIGESLTAFAVAFPPSFFTFICLFSVLWLAPHFMSARIHKWLRLYIVALWIIYRDICIYLCIYLSVLLLNSVAFGLLQRVDSQKSMLTWPEVLEMNVPGGPCRLNLCQSGEMTANCVACGMWQSDQKASHNSKLKTDVYRVWFLINSPSVWITLYL